MTNGQTTQTPGTKSAFNEVATWIERLPNKKSLKVFSGFVKWVTQNFYNFLSSLDRGENVVFMNYGYISFDPDRQPLQLQAEDERFRYQIQMYHHIASAVDWNGLHALEVGSGRGGGASYIKRHFKPKSMLGVDLSNKAVAFCNQFHASVEGLRFVQGDAEALQFPDKSFDIILNVESSLYYPNVERFFAHVARMLKPNGHFLYADMRYLDEVENWRRQLQGAGLELIHEEDITDNARRALSLHQEYRQSLVKKYAPRGLRKILSRFGGSDGGRLTDEARADGKRVYMKFVFRKPAAQTISG